MNRLLAAASLALIASTAATAADPAGLPDDVFAAGPATTAGTLPDDVFARAPDDDRIDVVLIGTSRVAVVRLNVTVAGHGYRRVWGDFAVRLHRFLDVDGDGVVTTPEANRAPWTNLLQNPFNGRRTPFRLVTAAVALDGNKDGKVTVEELLAYLRAMQDADALGVRPGAPPDDRAESVFAHIDRDGDRSISADELASVPGLLDRLDRDEDELLDLDELTPDRSPSARRFVANADPEARLDPEKSPVYVAVLDADRLKLAGRIASAFRKSPRTAPPAIAPEALGLTADAARPFDADRDGLLRAEEIAAYLKDPRPALVLSTALPAITDLTQRQPMGEVALTIVPGAAAPSPDGPTAKAGTPGVVVTFQGAAIELFATGQTNLPALQFFEGQFNQADGDQSGTINAQEARQNFYLQQIFPVADRNGDGKLTRDELKAYANLNADALTNKTLLSVADGGSTLHQRLDADADSRLSRRELRTAVANLRDLDLDRDGLLKLTEMPRRTIVTVGRDDGRNGARQNVVRRNLGGNTRPAESATAPVWFARMDRNRDGDVSPQEFLGPADHFRRFDADGDGLIDAAEAARTP